MWSKSVGSGTNKQTRGLQRWPKIPSLPMRYQATPRLGELADRGRFLLFAIRPPVIFINLICGSVLQFRKIDPCEPFALPGSCGGQVWAQQLCGPVHDSWPLFFFCISPTLEGKVPSICEYLNHKKFPDGYQFVFIYYYHYFLFSKLR